MYRTLQIKWTDDLDDDDDCTVSLVCIALDIYYGPVCETGE